MVKEEKIKQAQELSKKIDSFQTIGIIDMFKLPSKQLQKIRKELRGVAEIKMVKKSILLHAIRQSKKDGINELEKFIPSQPSLIFSSLEPFKLYSIVNKLRTPTFIKEGDIAEEDIEIKAGPTNLLPGPVISELTKAGIPVGVEEGKIAVKKDIVVAKKGDKISKELADALKKLKVQPVKIGLNIVAIYDGKIYQKDVLKLIDEYPKMIKTAYSHCLNLSVAICYPTKENIRYLITKCFNSAKVLESNVGVK